MNMKDSRYEEALKRARAGKPLYEVFPELKESEDERIRKWLIEEIKATHDYDSPTSRKCVDDALAYLEGQKEQRPLITEETELNSLAFLEQMGYTCIPPGKEQKSEIRIKIPKFRVGDIIQRVPLESWDTSRKIISIDEHGYNFDLSHLGDTVSGGTIGFAFEDEFELVEQKPADGEEKFESIDNAFRRGREVGFREGVESVKPAEWSEEDERMLNDIIRCLPARSSTEFNLKRINWLKHFRPQPHWKPSEYTLSLVKKVANGEMLTHMEQMAMETLCNDLQKLL